MHVIYDTESFPNLFICGLKPLGKRPVFYEISERRNDIAALHADLNRLSLMIGFNVMAYDYPMLHYLMMMAAQGPVTAATAYHKNQRIMAAQDKNQRFAEQVHYKDIRVPQLDLFLIHHFDNPARRTSLKALQFNMRSPSIEDSPLEFGKPVDAKDIPLIIGYNEHDLEKTEDFYNISKPAIEFRKSLGDKYRNYNDTKIGKVHFIDALQAKSRGLCYYSDGSARQTQRASIRLGDVILPYIRFEHPNFIKLLRDLKSTEIFKTKNAFEEHPFKADIDGFLFEFGTGGLHGSLNKKIVTADAENMILDADVTSFYPSIAISNNLYPEHLGLTFCDVYRDLKQKRLSYAKHTTENKALKLALNGVYGDSNSAYSVFFDPAYTMAITVNGQLLLCMLAEQLIMRVPGLQMLQANTDGITVRFPRIHRDRVDAICKWWQEGSKLDLEFAEYSAMWIRDVNNYMAAKTSGELKPKGVFVHKDLEWHKDHSGLVIPKAAEAELVQGTDLTQFISSHKDPFDFMMRAKATGESRLVLEDGTRVQKTSRYYVSTTGQKLFKIMPPIKGTTNERRMAVQSGRNVTICNRMEQGFVMRDVDIEFYVKEARKLTGDLRHYV